MEKLKKGSQENLTSVQTPVIIQCLSAFTLSVRDKTFLGNCNTCSSNARSSTQSSLGWHKLQVNKQIVLMTCINIRRILSRNFYLFQQESRDRILRYQFDKRLEQGVLETGKKNFVSNQNKICFGCISVCFVKPEIEFLDINLTKDSSRVSSKRETNFPFDQNKICFGCISVCFVKPKTTIFGLFRFF